MRIPPVEYLVWAKRHKRVRYELTVSGMPRATLADIDAGIEHVDLEVHGTYGHPVVMEAVGGLYGVAPGRVVPVPGTSNAIFNALAITCPRGGRVIIERPCYQPIQRCAEFLGIDVAWLDRKPQDDFAIDPERLRALLRDGASAAFLSNMHNPSAQLIDADTIAEIAAVCVEFGATLIVDEVYLDYAHVNLGTPRWTGAALADNVIAMSSLTKVYGLGGLRVGWMIVPQRLVNSARRIMDYLSVENAAPSASLAIRAFERLDRLEKRARDVYHGNIDIVSRWLASHPLLRSYPHHGANFCWIRLPDGMTAGRLNSLLVREYDTRVVPGEFFGVPDHVRLSYMCTTADLSPALRNVDAALERMKRQAVASD